MKKIKPSILLAASVMVLLFQVFASGYFSNHVGTDDQSVDLIKDIAPNYTPWASNLLEFQNDTMEYVLFAIQALLGLSVIVFYILKYQNKKV